MAGYRSRRRPRRLIIRENGGSLFDVTAGRQVSRSELGGYLAGGDFFQARRPDGADCTAQVLAEVLAEALGERPPPNLPRVSVQGHLIERLLDPWRDARGPGDFSVRRPKARDGAEVLPPRTTPVRLRGADRRLVAVDSDAEGSVPARGAGPSPDSGSTPSDARPSGPHRREGTGRGS